jgi:hypothetical protein
MAERIDFSEASELDPVLPLDGDGEGERDALRCFFRFFFFSVALPESLVFDSFSDWSGDVFAVDSVPCWDSGLVVVVLEVELSSVDALLD